jgi:hypothetical protein
MQRRWLLTLALLCWWDGNALAQNVAKLYPAAKLEADSARFAEMIQAEYRDTVLPQLTEAERTALSAIKIAVPTSGPRGDPFEFYTDGSTVFLPALSLRFFADLCMANSWLNAHSYDGTTVRDYVGFLFRQVTVSPSAPLPPVFATLGVPDNARDEPAVSNRADRNFGNTVVFLLAHELGHVLKKHRTDLHEPDGQRKQEIEADAFAIEIMRRIGQIPLGLEFWFDVERIRHQAPKNIPDNAEWQRELAKQDHPVTTERLNALAEAIEKAPDSFAKNQTNQAQWRARAPMFAQFFRLAAPFAANSVARVAEYSRIRDLRLDCLTPRKAAKFTELAGDGANQPFQGTYRLRRTFADGRRVPDAELLLLRSCNNVTGKYSSTAGDGFLEGKVANGVLDFTWREGDAKGRGKGETNADELRGTWGVGEQDTGAGTWEGARVKRQ